MKKFILKIGDLSSITVYSDIETVEKNFLLNPESLTKLLPVEIECIGDAHDVPERTNCVTVLQHNKKEALIDKENNVAALFSPKEEFRCIDLGYLLVGMFSNDLQNKGYYFMHASAVKYDDTHSIIFAGDPNAGKTSMAFSLVKDCNCKLISNDNVLVGLKDDRLVTYVGTKNVQMRYGALRTFFPELLPYFSVAEKDKDKDEWDLRVIIDDFMREQGYGYADDSIVTDVYGIATYDAGSTAIRRKSNIDQVLFVYEQITKTIRSCRHVLVGFNEPLPSFEREDLNRQRYYLSQAMCEHTAVYDARGTVGELSKVIAKKYR